MPDLKVLKATWAIRLFAWAKIPLIALIRPTILMVNSRTCTVRIPLNWLVKNHLRTMYFGALCIGADLAGGLIIMNMCGRGDKDIFTVAKALKVEMNTGA